MYIVPEEQDLAQALLEIATKYGKFNEDETGIWAGYSSPKENKYKEIGVKCENCVLYRGEDVCAIIALKVEAEGKCRFAVIPDGVVQVEPEQVNVGENRNVVSSGGYGAPAEVLEDSEKSEIKDSEIPEGYHRMPDGRIMRDDAHLSVSQFFSYEPELVQDELKSQIKDNFDKDDEDSYSDYYVEINELVPTQKDVTALNVCEVANSTKPVIVYVGLDGKMRLVDGHHRCAARKMKGMEGVPAKVYFETMTATAGSKPAPKKDRIKGSKKNPKGSAKTGKGVTFTKSIITALEKKVKTHNEKAPNGRRVTLAKLKAVYRRGAGAFSTSHRPDQNRNSWAMARVNAFLHLVRTGSPKNKKYTTDNDLLPKMHPKSTRASAALMPLIASLNFDYTPEDFNEEDLDGFWLFSEEPVEVENV